MPTNPYSPPNAEVKDPPSKPWSPVKSVLLGLAIDIGGSLIVSMVLVIIYIKILEASGMNQKDIDLVFENMPLTSPLMIVDFVLGSICSFWGGFACARVSKSSNYKLGIIMGAVSSAFGYVFLSTHHSVMRDAGFVALTFVCIMLGMKYGISKNARTK